MEFVSAGYFPLHALPNAAASDVGAVRGLNLQCSSLIQVSGKWASLYMGGPFHVIAG